MKFPILSLALWLGASVLSAAPTSRVEKQNLFVTGDNPSFQQYHIPGLVVTAKGTVLAWCEARRTPADWADIRFLLRRSTDDGVTWSEPQSIAKVSGPITKNPAALEIEKSNPDKKVNPADHTYNNPVLIADRDGAVHMIFCVEYMRVFYQRSNDDGLTWTEPTEITAVFGGYRPGYNWRVVATGPDHGIQLSNGRLLLPVWLSTGTGANAHHPSVVTTIYSDDRGQTWQRGEIAIPCTDEWVNPNETVAVELANGSVMLNARSESARRRRLVTVSPNGADSWSRPRFDEALFEPVCMAGLVRYQHEGRSLLLFCNPDSLADTKNGAPSNRKGNRRNLSVRYSEDEGKTWSVSKTLEPGWSMYSDIAVTKKGTILCLYGSADRRHFAGDRLTLARFDLAWLLDGTNQKTSSSPARAASAKD